MKKANMCVLPGTCHTVGYTDAIRERKHWWALCIADFILIVVCIHVLIYSFVVCTSLLGIH